MEKRTAAVAGAAVIFLIAGVALFVALGDRPPVTPRLQTETRPAGSRGVVVESPAAAQVPEQSTVSEDVPEHVVAEPETRDVSDRRVIPRAGKPMLPEDQPRQFLEIGFAGRAWAPRGHTVDNLEFGKEGITLLPVEEGEEGEPRFGSLTSGAEPLEFQSNAVAPLWKESLPDGTDVIMELAMSPDGETWSDWFLTEPDSHNEILQYRPDGSLNPNYGYQSGGLLNWGANTWGWFRYRITLYSETGDSPSVESFRLYYQDSTMGEGQPVEVTNVEDFEGYDPQ